MTVSLLIMPANVSQEFDQWVQRGALTGRYPGLVLPASVDELASAAVHIDPPR
ncbi:hypothetical protein OHQ89_15970 [Streptomyces canus]|uniref:hypothetical protein n=1 Tax=Streptomyces canus TaxID=58343 RepID=UPI0030E09CA0